MVRRLFSGGLAANMGALAFFVSRYGRGYRLEIAVISTDWLVLIAASFLMAVVYRREPGGCVPETFRAQ